VKNIFDTYSHQKFYDRRELKLFMYLWNKEFPIDEKKKVCFSMIMIGPRKSGKSFMIKHLLATSLKKRFDQIIVFSTMEGLKFYRQFIPGKMLYDGYKEDIIEKVRTINAKRKKPFNILVIMDDTNSKKQKYNSSIQSLYTNGRHSQISVIYCAQMAQLTDNSWKSNSDIILIFDVDTTRAREYVVRNLLSGVIKNKYFDRISDEERYYMNILRKVTEEKHRALVLLPLDHELYHYKIG